MYFQRTPLPTDGNQGESYPQNKESVQSKNRAGEEYIERQETLSEEGSDASYARESVQLRLESDQDSELNVQESIESYFLTKKLDKLWRVCFKNYSSSFDLLKILTKVLPTKYETRISLTVKILEKSKSSILSWALSKIKVEHQKKSIELNRACHLVAICIEPRLLNYQAYFLERIKLRQKKEENPDKVNQYLIKIFTIHISIIRCFRQREGFASIRNQLFHSRYLQNDQLRIKQKQRLEEAKNLEKVRSIAFLELFLSKQSAHLKRLCLLKIKRFQIDRGSGELNVPQNRESEAGFNPELELTVSQIKSLKSFCISRKQIKQKKQFSVQCKTRRLNRLGSILGDFLKLNLKSCFCQMREIRLGSADTDKLEILERELDALTMEADQP